MKKTSNTAEEQNMFCDGPPGEGRERFMRMSGGHSKASRVATQSNIYSSN